MFHEILILGLIRISTFLFLSLRNRAFYALNNELKELQMNVYDTFWRVYLRITNGVGGGLNSMSAFYFSDRFFSMQFLRRYKTNDPDNCQCFSLAVFPFIYSKLLLIINVTEIFLPC